MRSSYLAVSLIAVPSIVVLYSLDRPGCVQRSLDARLASLLPALVPLLGLSVQRSLAGQLASCLLGCRSAWPGSLTTCTTMRRRPRAHSASRQVKHLANKCLANPPMEVRAARQVSPAAGQTNWQRSIRSTIPTQHSNLRPTFPTSYEPENCCSITGADHQPHMHHSSKGGSRLHQSKDTSQLQGRDDSKQITKQRRAARDDTVKPTANCHAAAKPTARDVTGENDAQSDSKISCSTLDMFSGSRAVINVDSLGRTSMHDSAQREATRLMLQSVATAKVSWFELKNWNGKGSGIPSETDLTLWIGHGVNNSQRKVIGIHVPLRSRTSRGKKATRNVVVVLPVAKTKLSATNSSIDGDPPLPGAPPVPHVRFAFALDAAPFAVMPVPRRPMQKPLDDSPGYLVTCLRSLTTAKQVDVHVARDSAAEQVLHALADAALQGSLADLPINVDAPGSDGATRAINCWHHYPVTTDEWTRDHGWNPYVDADPPAYSECGATAADKTKPLLSPSPVQDAAAVVYESPDEAIGWHIPSTPNSKKRKAASSASPPPGRREPLLKEHLDALSAATAATEPVGTDDVYQWAAAANAQKGQSHLGTSSSSAGISFGTADARADRSNSLSYYNETSSFSRPDMTAPRLSAPLTSLWRMELTKANAIFFDLVALLHRALRCDPSAHETHLADWLDLGFAARLAVRSLTDAGGGSCTPEREQTQHNFDITRDRIAQRVIAGAVDKEDGEEEVNPKDAIRRGHRRRCTWDPAPFPLDPGKQVEYVRGWVNTRLQVNGDADMVDELVDLGRAARRLVRSGAVFCVFGDDDDLAAAEFEFARARCLGAAFYKFGGFPVLIGAEKES
ncbi:hypothetical protein IWX92DRAFT_389853 [Phyllosticta citricarpa]